MQSTASSAVALGTLFSLCERLRASRAVNPARQLFLKLVLSPNRKAGLNRS